MRSLRTAPPWRVESLQTATDHTEVEGRGRGHIVKTKRQMSVHSVLGPVAVIYVDEVLSDQGKPLEALGHISFERRLIQIKNGLHPTQEAHTLRHEWVHLVLWDSGASNLLSERKTEVLCDALATALIAVPIA